MTVIDRNTYQSAVDRARDLLARAELPVQGKPTGMEKEYSFPTDPAALSSNELGRMMLKLASWRGYCARILAQIDAELTALTPVYNIILGREMTNVSNNREGARLVKEQLTAVAMDRNEELQNLYALGVEKQAAKIRFHAQWEIYNDQWAALSREQSRRDADQKRSS